jgi:hypothetical protein
MDPLSRLSRHKFYYDFSRLLDLYLAMIGLSLFSRSDSVTLLTLAATNDTTQPRLPYTSDFPQPLCCGQCSERIPRLDPAA